MSGNLGKFAMVIAALTAAVAVPAFAEIVDAGRTISERFKTFDRNTVWQPSGQIPLNFPTFHSQGMVIEQPDFWKFGFGGLSHFGRAY